jgi:hypothetical protein
LGYIEQDLCRTQSNSGIFVRLKELSEGRDGLRGGVGERSADPSKCPILHKA